MTEILQYYLPGKFIHTKMEHIKYGEQKDESEKDLFSISPGPVLLRWFNFINKK